MPAKETDESESQTTDSQKTTDDAPKLSTKRDSSWPSVLFYIHLNILGLYGIIVLFTNTCFTTVIFTSFLTLVGILGVTCGAHRLWAHHAYTANTFLKIALMLSQTMAGQVIGNFYYLVDAGMHIICTLDNVTLWQSLFSYLIFPIFIWKQSILMNVVNTVYLA